MNIQRCTCHQVCQERIATADGSWACRRLAILGVLDMCQAPPPPLKRKPCWSIGRVIRCPNCGNPAYSDGPAGQPERRCDGPSGCRLVFNPEAPADPVPSEFARVQAPEPPAAGRR